MQYEQLLMIIYCVNIPLNVLTCSYGSILSAKYICLEDECRFFIKEKYRATYKIFCFKIIKVRIINKSPLSLQRKKFFASKFRNGYFIVRNSEINKQI